MRTIEEMAALLVEGWAGWRHDKREGQERRILGPNGEKVTLAWSQAGRFKMICHWPKGVNGENHTNPFYWGVLKNGEPSPFASCSLSRDIRAAQRDLLRRVIKPYVLLYKDCMAERKRKMAAKQKQLDYIEFLKNQIGFRQFRDDSELTKSYRSTSSTYRVCRDFVHIDLRFVSYELAAKIGLMVQEEQSSNG